MQGKNPHQLHGVTYKLKTIERNIEEIQPVILEENEFENRARSDDKLHFSAILAYYFFDAIPKIRDKIFENSRSKKFSVLISIEKI